MIDEPPTELLGEADVPWAVELLAESFAGYPLFRALVAHAAHEPAARRAGLEFFVRLALTRGELFATPDRGAVAGWLPPGGEWFGTLASVRAGGLSLCWALGWRATRAFDRLGHAAAALRAVHVRGPHWYLLILGVRPDRQRRGLARAVLGPVFGRADRDGLPCYLETMTEANVGVYRRLGFEVVGEAKASGLRFWGMRRDPG